MPARNPVLRPSPKSETIISGLIYDAKGNIVKKTRFRSLADAKEWARNAIKHSAKLKTRRVVKIKTYSEETYFA